MIIDYSDSFGRQIKRLFKRYRSIKKDIQPIINDLAAGHVIGDKIIAFTENVYKVRIKNSDNNKGKSGGYRCIYYLKTQTHCTLIAIYSKSDQGDITAQELNAITAQYK